MDTRELLLKALRTFRHSEYDWDGSGGLPLRDDVADTFYDLISNDVTHEDMYDMLPVPMLNLNGNGTLELVLGWHEGAELVLTFQAKDVITYVKIFEDAQTSVEGTLRLDYGDDDNTAVAELTELLEWIVQE